VSKIILVTPAVPGSRAGNRVTAVRWSRMLRSLGHTVQVVTEFHDQRGDLLLALHARRSAASVARFAKCRAGLPVVVALTGTDLYRDIRTHAAAQRSLELADRLVLLQPHGLAELPEPLHSKARVIIQSADPPRRRLRPLPFVFEVCVAGHLRDVKDPFRAALAARRLPADSRIRITHIGAALSESMHRRAVQEAARNPRYRWRGCVSAGRAQALMARARLLLLTSKMEGGANVLSEAIVAGTPVLASRVSGSLGMLGEDYAGYFTVGDTNALARLMRRCESEPAFLELLERQCTARRPLFDPSRERAAWESLLESIMIAD